MSKDQIIEEAYKISEDIYDEHGMDVHGTLTEESAIDTVKSYGYEGEELQKIAITLLFIMES
jgi:hypothetical protein